ncbi:MAG: RNA methyltransferase, partial [Clostridia bacterium]|nr:RNA methyltransferase [Clostridia bacterium]
LVFRRSFLYKMVITSRSNERIKRIASLKDKKARKASGLYIVEGFKMVKEAFLNGEEVVALVGTEEGIERLGEEFSDTLIVAEEVMKKLCDSVTPQGVLAVLKQKRLTEEFSGSVGIMLDGISDPGNMGTIIRTAAAVGVKKIYAVNCCDPYAPKCVRSSMSGIYFTEVVETTYDGFFKAINGVPLIVADMDGESVYDFKPPEKYCLVVGGEADGVTEEVRKRASGIVKIPMKERTESLNAAISLAVTLYELTYGKGN